MTRYEKGFLTKCAEYGLSEEQADGLMKRAYRPGVNRLTQMLLDPSKPAYYGRHIAELADPAALQRKADRLVNKTPYDTIAGKLLLPGPVGAIASSMNAARSHTQLTDAANAARMRNARARADGLMAPRQFKDDGQW